MNYDDDWIAWDYIDEIGVNTSFNLADDVVFHEYNQYFGENYMNLQIKNSDGNCIGFNIEKHAVKCHDEYQIFYKGVQVVRIEEKIMKLDKLPRNYSCSDKISIENRQILFQWLVSHEKNPYPKLADFIDLEQKTGLERRRIRIFFTNYRARLLKRSPRGGMINQSVMAEHWE